MKKYIKLFEEYTEQQNAGHPGFLKSKDEIHKWLKKHDRDYHKNTYTINDDWSVDVKGNVSMSQQHLIDRWDRSYLIFEYLSVYFKFVNESFYCSGNNDLRTLEGSPIYVGRDFGCKDNNLKSLKYAPDYVGGSFYCQNNHVITLEGAPDEVGGDFNCKYNPNLVTLGHKSTIKGEFIYNGILGSLEVRVQRYINYLNTLNEQEKKSSLQWLFDVDEKFHKSVVEYALNNDINLPGVNKDIAFDALKHKDSGLF